MHRKSLATFVLVALGILCPNHSAKADGFEAVGLRALARELGVGLGQGYHAVPCAKHLAQHYNRSVEGVVHPLHRLSPLYQHNAPHPYRLRGRRCERAPYYLGSTMPPLHMPMPVPTVGPNRPDHALIDPQPTLYDPNQTEDASGDNAGESDQPEADGIGNGGSKETSNGDESVLIERLPAVDDAWSEAYSPSEELEAPFSGDRESGDVEDGVEFNKEADDVSTGAADLSNPLTDHPLWDENGPGQPRLYNDLAPSQTTSNDPW